MTLTELAGTLSKSITWLNDRLGLVKLSEPILKLVDESKINLSNAYALSKLPQDEQQNFVDRAIALSPNEFVPIANDRVKEVRDAKRQGRNPNPEQFSAHARFRKMSELEKSMDDLNVAQAVLLSNPEIQDPANAFLLGIRWSLQLDKESVQLAKEKDDARKRELQEKKDAAKRERQAQKEKEAAEKHVSVQQELADAKAPATAGATA